MDEVRELSQADKKIFSLHIYSDRLLNQTRTCPDDGAWMAATGHMFLRTSVSRWIVEFVCPKDGEIIRSWSPELDAITKEIAKQVVGDDAESQ